jgi:hypothetical protein
MRDFRNVKIQGFTLEWPEEEEARPFPLSGPNETDS